MLRRRFMMQSKKSSSLFVYHCKFELQYGGQTNQYAIGDNEGLYYGIGFVVIGGEPTPPTTTLGIPSIMFADFINYDTSVDNLEIKITKPNSSVATYNIPLASVYTSMSVEQKEICGYFTIFDNPVELSSGLAAGIEYKWVATPPFLSQSSGFDSGIAIAGTGDDNKIILTENNLSQGTYTVELTYTSSADLSSEKLYIFNVGNVTSSTSGKTTTYNHCASLCKKQFLQTDGVFVDNMYKSNGSI